MNPNKRNYNGWILCPSKTFPGKYYFFNVLNGEAAWNLNDVEKNAMQSNFHKVTDKWHSYPEPDSPPVDDPPLNWHYKKQEIKCERPMHVGPMHGQTFGQATFQKQQEPFSSNVVWIPVQKPMMSTDCHYKTWNTDGQFSQNSTLSNHYVWCDKPTAKMQENVFSNKVYDANSNNKWPNYNSTSFGPKTQKNIFESNSGNQVFGHKPEVFRNVQFDKNPDQPILIKRSFFNTAITKSAPDHTKPIPKSNENLTVENSGFGLWSLGPRKRTGFTRTRSESEAYQNIEPIFQSKPNENVTADNPTFGIWSSSPRKRVQFCQSNQVFPKENFCFKYEEPDSLDEYNLSPTKKTKTQSDCIPAKSVSNLTAPEGYFMPSLSPVKKVPQTPAFLNKNLSKSIEDLTNENSIRMSNLNPKMRVQNTVNTNKSKEMMEVQKENDLVNLEISDLRYLLLAKKRKFGDVDTKTKADKGKRNALNNVEEEAVPPKKRVTFNLGVQYDDSLDEEEQDEDIPDQEELSQDEPFDLTIETLKSLAAPTMDADLWYIAVDTEVLLEDFEFIYGYVQTDEQCNLLIAPVVKAEIEAMSIGSCLGRPHVMAARHLSRRLHTTRHITVLPADVINEMSTDDAIINCCMQMIEENFHVVLIVKDTELHAKAKSLNLHCFELQEIKDGAAVPKPEVSFDLKKIQNCYINNQISEKNNNVFPKTFENNPFAVSSRKDIPVNCFRKGLFGQNNTNSFLFQSNNKNTVKLKQKENQKISTDCEKSRLTIFPPKVTQPNQKATFQNESTLAVTTFQINRGIENLNLNESFFQNDSLAEEENLPFKKPNKQQIKNTEANQPQIQNISNGIRKIKNINSYTIDEHLKRFYVINKCMEERIKNRIDEYICCFTQIMEDVLSDVLQDTPLMSQNTPPPPPWSLTEALDSLADLFNNATLKSIVEKLAALWCRCCSNLQLRLTMLPTDFMKIFGCGVLLIKWLKQTILPHSTSLAEAEFSLTNLLENIEDPADPDPLVIQAPVPNRFERTERKNFVKNSSEVVMYLKKHFREWRSYGGNNNISAENVESQQKKSSPNIIRTFGKTIDQSKLDVAKSISLNTPTNGTDIPNLEIQEESNSIQTVEKLTTTVLNRFPHMKEIDLEKRESVNKDLMNMIDHIVKGEVHTFYYKPKPSEKKVRILLTDHNETKVENGNKTEDVNVSIEPHDGPEMIRNAKETKCFVKKFTEDSFDLDALDYSELDDNTDDITSLDTVHIQSSSIKDNIETTKNTYLNTKKEYDKEKNKYCDKNDVDFSIDTTNDSGFESRQAHSLVKTFLMKLSESLEIVHNFIDANIREYREKDIQEEKRRVMHETADKTHTCITAIIDKLKSITERESAEGTTLKKLLESAGVQTSTDIHYARYSQVITKCLEQAQILDCALKIMLSLDDDCRTPSMVKSINTYNNTNIQYYI